MLSAVRFLFFMIAMLVTSSVLAKHTIGMIVPMEHQALTDIVEGFKQTLSDIYPNDKVIVRNAMGDILIQKTIVDQFQHQNIDLLVPIGTATTQMTMRSHPKVPIVALAADIKSVRPDNVAGVLDEIDMSQQLEFMFTLYPTIKKIALVYSSQEKVLPEVDKAVALSKQRKVTVQRIMIKDLPELYSVSRMIAPDAELIFILKDHLVVSGIQTLAKEAKNRKIPIMTSDEGSVKNGGAFALGVQERKIGEKGAKLAKQVLEGALPSSLPIEMMNDLAIFYNATSCIEQGIDINLLRQVANKFGYAFEGNNLLGEKS